MTQRAIFEHLYRQAKRPEDLPWAHREPTAFLPEVVSARAPGRALDIGCGTGVDSVFLASRGWAVTSLDFMTPALAMTRARAEAAGVSVTTAEAAINEWAAPHPFDFIVDAGCFHNMPRSERAAYRARLLSCLPPGGDYVLVHFDKRHALDWRPIGPKRIARPDILAFFAPELTEQAYVRTVHTGQRLPIGPTFAMNTFWLRRV
jgi:SAM-dependent methyltransferase